MINYLLIDMKFGVGVSGLSLKSRNLFSDGKTSEYKIVSGYGSIFDIVDSHGDIIVKGAFSCANQKQVKLLWQHDPNEPIGFVKNLIEDDKGLWIDAEINTKISRGSDAVSLIEQGVITDLSVGFFLKKYSYNSKNQRVIYDLDLVEISIVTFGANKDSKIKHVKSLNLWCKRYKRLLLKLDHITKTLSDV